jgi:hypothetical protein
MKKDKILKDLIDSLSKLVGILEMDPGCQWIEAFRNSLNQAQSLVGRNYGKEELRNLSTSITHVYGGMGSFNDYWPGIYDPNTGRYTQIPGTEDFKNVSGEVYNLALELRVIGRY